MNMEDQIYGLVQERRNSSTLAMELGLSWSNSLKYALQLCFSCTDPSKLKKKTFMTSRQFLHYWQIVKGNYQGQWYGDLKSSLLLAWICYWTSSCWWFEKPWCLCGTETCIYDDGLVQHCSISSSLAMDILQSGTKPLIYFYICLHIYWYFDVRWKVLQSDTNVLLL